MSEPKDQTEAACGGSALTAELGNEIERYLRQLAPHQSQREAARLLRGALAEIARMRDLVRKVADEPNIDKARAMADAEFRVPNVEVTGLRSFSRRSG